MKKNYTFLRQACQILFLLACLFIGFEFYQFVIPLEQGTLPSVSRPPGVEAFLPISAMVSLKYFLVTGIINQVHPSALVILGFVLITSIGVKKGFCSWVCPVGFLSELLWLIRPRQFKKIVMPGVIDWMLRSLKYLLLLFFLYTILWQMNSAALEQFIHSSYNIVADIKMLRFFTHMSGTTMAVLTGLVVLSFVFPYFWCRYLCPYGALLGLAGFLSPVKVRRNESSCTDCGRCNRVCPSRINISRKDAVQSDECFGCGRCADACPEPHTLTLSWPITSKAVPAAAIAGFVLIVFLGGSLLARTAGIWHNQVPDQYYLTAMLETDLIDFTQVKDVDELIQHLDRRGKRLLMMKMMNPPGQ